MSIQTDLAWELVKQKGQLVGRQDKDGNIHRNDLPSWEVRKLTRTDNDGSLKGMFEEPEKANPKLVEKPSVADKEATKSYAQLWRERQKVSQTGQTGFRKVI